MTSGFSTPPNVWIISGQDRARHDQQFFAQKPVNGFITGEQARNFFLKSGLPSNILAQVWNLADLNKDGKMDRKEFSIAMHLIQKKLQGFSLPQSLPESMKADPQPAFGSFGPLPQQQQHQQPIASQPMRVMNPGANMTLPAAGSQQGFGFGAPVMPPHQPYGTLGSSPVTPSVPTGIIPRKDSKTIDWSMPQATKLKYSQMFNNLDKNRVGFLSGVHARNIMSHAGLPNAALAQIWNLSDLDKDGKLTCDEFTIAMHLIDMVKTGACATLPPTTPIELIQQSPRARTLSSTSGASSVEGGGTNGMAVMDGLDLVTKHEEPPQKSHPVSFEDRRKENFDRGQAELERRRQLLQEQEKREREERLRKEREEMERREAERREAEKRRQLEIEKHLAKQRELEQQREAEHRKMMEQREAARRELEKQRQHELEKLKLQELTHERQQEQEMTCHLKQKHKNLSFQYQALCETSGDLNSQITDIRTQMLAYTNSIEGMRRDRDEKMAAITSLKMQIEDANRKLGSLLSERQGLESQKTNMNGPGTHVTESYRQVMHSYHNKEINMEKLKASIAELERERREKEGGREEKTRNFETLRSQLNDLKQEQSGLLQSLTSKQTKAKSQMGKTPTPTQEKSPVDAWGPPIDQASAFDNSDFGDAFAPAVPSAASGVVNNVPKPVSVKYRALYEFSAQNEDELSFQPGDVIEVFTNHAAEPGWMAGQFRDKLGWFPEAYAVPLDDTSGEDPQAGSETSPPVGTQSPGQTARIVGSEVKVLDGIHEEESSFEKEDVASAPTPSMQPRIPKSSTGDSIGSTHSNGAAASHELQPRAICQAQALYPWKAKKGDQLTFAKGDTLNILEQGEMWWRGRLPNGKEGWFPKSYAKVTDTGALSAPQDNQAMSSGGGEKVYCVALYNFVAVETDDLGFTAGDQIEVLSGDGEWWTGRFDGKEGIFPANHVRLMSPTGGSVPAATTATAPPILRSPSQENAGGSRPVIQKQMSSDSTASSIRSENISAAQTYEVGQVIAPFSGAAENQLTIQPGDLVKIRAKSPTGWWEGELQRKGEQKRAGWFPGNFVKTLSQSQDSSSGPEGGKTPKSASNDSIVAASDCYVTLYDYTAQQPDELSFKEGTKVLVLEKVDESWWKGKVLETGSIGMFPVNYVQPLSGGQGHLPPPQHTSPAGTPGSGEIDLRFEAENGQKGWSAEEKKRSIYLEELVQTERNYLDDLDMIRKVFFQPITEAKILSESQEKQLQINLEELRRVGKQFYKAIRGAWQRDEAECGRVIRDFLPKLKVFVTFCKYQQGALDLVESLERSNPQFRQVYNHCLQHPAARHLGLSYFLLIPMTRVTKYPLLLEKILKYTDKDQDPDQHELYSQALIDMKNLCKEVNHVVSEMENLEMLYWCQNHVKTETIRPKLVFHSLTHSLGPRKFLHSGVLFKTKSGRLLVGLLFNDILLLTTPEDDVVDSVSFKLTRISDVELSLYRSPILLAQASLSSGPNNEELSICTPAYTTHLKAVNPSARVLWVRELDKAIKTARSDSTLSPTASPAPSKGIGRLLLEVVCVRGLATSADHLDCPTLCELVFGGQFQRYTVDCKKGQGTTQVDPGDPSGSLVSTQFVIEDKSAELNIAFYAALVYAPNLCLGSMEVGVAQILKDCGVKRTPSVKQYPLNSALGAEDSNCCVILKCVVHMFE